MAQYNLSNNMADRINYDDAQYRYFQDQLKFHVGHGGDLADVDRSTFDAWFDISQEDVDDEVEAEARAWDAFGEALTQLRAERAEWF